MTISKKSRWNWLNGITNKSKPARISKIIKNEMPRHADSYVYKITSKQLNKTYIGYHKENGDHGTRNDHMYTNHRTSAWKILESSLSVDPNKGIEIVPDTIASKTPSTKQISLFQSMNNSLNIISRFTLGLRDFFQSFLYVLAIK